MKTIIRLRMDAPDWRTFGYYQKDKRGTQKMTFIKAKRAITATLAGRSYMETIDGDYLIIQAGV